VRLSGLVTASRGYGSVLAPFQENRVPRSQHSLKMNLKQAELERVEATDLLYRRASPRVCAPNGHRTEAQGEPWNGRSEHPPGAVILSGPRNQSTSSELSWIKKITVDVERVTDNPSSR
jgi:hypothetical protein